MYTYVECTLKHFFCVQKQKHYGESIVAVGLTDERTDGRMNVKQMIDLELVHSIRPFAVFR